MAKVHVKKGDTVLVIAGKDKGKKGKVLRVIPADSRVVVEGVSKVKRHTKPGPKNMQGGIIEKEAPIHSSNVMVWDDKANAPTRIAHKVLENGKKVRVSVKSGASLDD